MGIIKEFKEFAMKGNVMDMAVGVIIGGAFGKIISSLVDNIIMPVINPIIPGGNWRELQLGPMKVGAFGGSVLDFVIIALAIFFMLKALNSMKKEEAAAPAAPAEPSSTDKLLMEIRDSLKNRN